MSEEANKLPFKILGVQLKGLRQKARETLAQAAGAVEIDEVALERIEKGNERPSEDILMLLISHFGIHEDEATNLWLLAGYDQPVDKAPENLEESENRSVVVMMTIDARILYSDQAQVSADKNGVVLNFLQANNLMNGRSQQMPIARIGMSYEQAHDLLHILQTTVAQGDKLRRPKSLPASSKQNVDPKPKKNDPDS